MTVDPTPKKRILIVDDEPEICRLLENRLKQEAYETYTANDGFSALEQVKSLKPDLIILDVMMPGRDGIEVCRELKSEASLKHIPVVMLTARGTPTDEVLGLEIGADDYIVKPYEYRVLSTRIKKLLSRQIDRGQGRQGNLGAVLEAGPIRLDSHRQKVTVDGKDVHLTSLEFRILQTFMNSPGIVFDRKKLIEETWKGEANLEGRAVDVHITSLRKKLSPHSDYIETVYGAGYRFKEVT